VVGVALVAEARAVAHHCNHARLGAVDEMRHHAMAAVLAHGHRDRHPGGRIRQRLLDAAAGGFRQPQAVAGVAVRSRGDVLAPARRVRKQFLSPFDVMRKAAAGQHHAPPCDHAHDAALAHHDCAAYRAVLHGQFVHRRGQPQGDVEVEGRFGEPRDQRITVGQRHAAAVADHVGKML